MPGDGNITPPRSFWGGSTRREKHPSTEVHPVRHAYISIVSLVAIIGALVVAVQHIVSALDRAKSEVREEVRQGVRDMTPALIDGHIKIHEEKDIDKSHAQIKPRLDEIRDDVREIKQIIQRRLGR